MVRDGHCFEARRRRFSNRYSIERHFKKPLTSHVEGDHGWQKCDNAKRPCVGPRPDCSDQERKGRTYEHRTREDAGKNRRMRRRNAKSDTYDCNYQQQRAQ